MLGNEWVLQEGEEIINCFRQEPLYALQFRVLNSSMIFSLDNFGDLVCVCLSTLHSNPDFD